jgi:hypothetical protein
VAEMYGMYQPYQMQGYNNYNQVQSLTRVNGIDGARAYQMGANSTAALFDSNDDILYIKTTDGAGFPTIRVFEFKEKIAEMKENLSECEFVSKAEFEKFKKEVGGYVKQFIFNTQNNGGYNQSGATNDEYASGQQRLEFD